MTPHWNSLFSLPVPPVLLAGKECGNASHRDTQLRWSPPSIACEPILPTPAVTRTYGAWRTRRRGNTLGNFHERKYLDVLAAPMLGPSATKRSTCYIHPPHWTENDGLSFNNGRCGQETASSTHSTSTIAF